MLDGFYELYLAMNDAFEEFHEIFGINRKTVKITMKNLITFFLTLEI